MTCIFNKFNLNKVKDIEKRAYPSFMWQFQDIETPEEAYEEVDCDGQFFCHIDNGWYMLGCNGPDQVYIEDLASVRNLGFSELNTILKVLRGFGNKIITADCRSSTSYRLMKIAEKRGSIEILKEEPWSWGSETMYEMTFKVKPESFREWLELTEALDQQTKTRIQRVNPKIFPDRAALEKLIQQMEDEPELIPPATAFARVNQLGGIQQNRTQQKLDSTIQKANAMLPNPSSLLQALQKEYQNKQISNPELLSLTYLSAKGASDEQISQLAQEIKSLDKAARQNIIFPNDKPVIKTPNGVQAVEDMTQFSSAIHAMAAQGVDLSKQTYFDPKTDIRPERQKDLIIAKNGIYIYRGSNPMACRTYGKGATWCIASSSSTTWYFTYRHDHKQTQYFIFDTNKDEDDPARIVNPGVAEDGGYSEWVDLKNSHTTDADGISGFGINGYSSIEDYKEYLAQKLGVSMEQLNTEVFKALPITKEEEKLKYYLDAYEKAS